MLAIFNTTAKSQELEDTVLHRVLLLLNLQAAMRSAESAMYWKLKEILKIFMMITYTTFRQGVLDSQDDNEAEIRDLQGSQDMSELP